MIKIYWAKLMVSQRYLVFRFVKFLNQILQIATGKDIVIRQIDERCSGVFPNSWQFLIQEWFSHKKGWVIPSTWAELS